MINNMDCNIFVQTEKNTKKWEEKIKDLKSNQLKFIELEEIKHNFTLEQVNTLINFLEKAINENQFKMFKNRYDDIAIYEFDGFDMNQNFLKEHPFIFHNEGRSNPLKILKYLKMIKENIMNKKPLLGLSRKGRNDITNIMSDFFKLFDEEEIKNNNLIKEKVIQKQKEYEAIKKDIEVFIQYLENLKCDTFKEQQIIFELIQKVRKVTV